MKKLYSKKLWERVCAVVMSLLVLLYVGYGTAMDYAPQINYSLGISQGTVVSSNSGEYQYFTRDYSDAETLTAYLDAVGIEAENEGIVLLKNDNNALPLAAGSKVSLFMNGSVNFNYGSSGSSAANTEGYATLKDAMTTQGFQVNEDLWEFYTTGKAKRDKRTTIGNTYLVNEASWEKYDEDLIATFSDYDVAIVTLARNSGEGKDLTTYNSDGEDGSYLSITPTEAEVLTALTQLKNEGKVSKIIVLLNSSAPLQLSFLERDGIDVDACLWIGNVGKTGIYGVAQTLAGASVPSGKASDTFLMDNFTNPAMASWILNDGGIFSQLYTNAADLGLNATQENYGVYVEGIYVGYRYYETRYEDYVMGTANADDYDYSKDVAYPFGHGLSYTDFEFSGFSVADQGNTLEVTVTVTNVGSQYSGKEVVQVYLQKPYTDYDKENGIEKASVELAGFAKTGMLAPGDSQTLTVTVEKEQFKSYDSYGARTYILDAGDYYLTVADNAHAAVNNILAAKGYTPAEGKMDAAGDAAMTFKWVNATLDTTTYSVSAYTGEAITNRFDNADMNLYAGAGDNRVTYVSRSDWTGTWPTAQTLFTVTEQMKLDLTSPLPVEDDGSESPRYGQKGDLTLAQLRGLPYDDEKWEQLLDQMTYAEQASLVTTGQFSTVPITSIVKPETKENDGPTGIAGSVTGASFPSQGIWASSFNTELIQKVGDAFAEDALLNGYTGVYAGGINIHRTSFGGRSHEYFSEDPYLSGVASAAEIKGLQNKGVITHVKHLAFNDEESNRNGIGIWLNEQSAREIYLLPFEYSLSASRGGSHAVMTSFNRIGCIWAGAHDGMLLDLLHGEWDFEGYNITDMASSNGAIYMTYDSFYYGTDLFLGSGSETALDAYKDNPAFRNRLREATHNILYAVANYSAAMNGIGPDDRVETSMPYWQAALLAALGTVGVLSAVSGIMYCLSWKEERKQKTAV